MPASATIRFNPTSPSAQPSPSAQQSPGDQPSPASQPSAYKPKSREWSPSDRDRLIFQWVKFDGHTQSWVAQQLELSQSTVSRIVERYERWIARGGPGRQGGLTYDERVRYQRWLTYERNEWVLGSAFRLAGQMERALETSKSTITTDASRPSQETQVRTEHKMLDRSGIASRFLRLAHRVNMDQLALVQQEPLPDLEPLTIDEAEEFEATGTVPPSEAAMHGVHNEAPVETGSGDGGATTCAKNTASEKPFSDAYPAGDYPPEITEVQLSATGLCVHMAHAAQDPIAFPPLVRTAAAPDS